MPSSTSSPTVASSASPESVVDTVVLRYFALVDETDLLIRLLGEPIGTPRVVYDHDEGPHLPDDARSEITRSIAYQQRASGDPARDHEARRNAARNATRLAAIASLHTSGRLTILDMEHHEVELMGRLTSPTGRKAFGLRFPLDPGEAACLAIAVHRGLVLATDDADALRALERHKPGHPYQRIRKLLITAVDRGICARDRANAIHREMRRLGFWDREDPFPVGT